MADTVTLQIEPSTLGAIDELARRSNQPRDAVVEEALRNFVRLRAWQIAKIEAGIAAPDRGEFATEDQLDEIERETASGGSYLASLEPLLSEWDSLEDAEAYDGL